MTLAVDDVAPSEVVQGDTYVWTVSPPTGFAPTDGYAASVRFLSATARVNGTAVASGRDWSLTLSAANSTALPGGTVTWQLVVTQGTDVRTIASDSFRLIAVPKLGAGSTSISYNERMLSLWKARAEQQAGDLLQEYDIGGTRRAKRYTPQEVQRQVAFWTGKVFAERNGGASLARVHSVRF